MLDTRWMWEVFKTKVRKIRVAKAKERKNKRRTREKITKEEKAEKEENNENKESSREVRDLGQKEESSKIWKEAKKLILQRFHKWIYVFGKKASERMLTKKLWDYTIGVKKEFVLRKKKIYLLSKEEKGEVQKFIKEQLRKWYIRPSKLPQMVLVFFVEKKNGKKYIVQVY